MKNIIGRVTRCSTRGFTGAMRLPEPEFPTFGSFCLAKAQQGQSEVVGLIYDLSVGDDEFARQIAASETATPEQIADHQTNRQIPVEFRALAIGFHRSDGFHTGVPPQPPMPLDPITMLIGEALLEFSKNLNFLAIISSAPQVPVVDLMAAAVMSAADAQQPADRRDFLLAAGRHSARLLGHDLVQLERVLAAINPTNNPQ